MIIPFKWQLYKLFLLLILFIWNYFHLVVVLNLIKQQMMVSISTEARHVWTLHSVSKLSKTSEVIMILTQWRTDNFRQTDNVRHLRWKNTILKSGFGSCSQMPDWPSNRFFFKRIRCRYWLILDLFWVWDGIPVLSLTFLCVWIFMELRPFPIKPILKYTCIFMWNRTNTTKVWLICCFF